MASTATATTGTAGAKSPAKKRAARPIYMVWRRVIDEQTGELRMGLCADSSIDQFLCREREYRAGDQVRCEIKKARNVKFHRLVHALGRMVSEQVDKFHGLDAHTTIKKLQLDASVCCTYEAFDIPDLGRVMRQIPESISFDYMTEERFREFWRGICQHLIEKYWPGLTEEAIEQMTGLMPGEREQ
ncbi:hypothetical protein BVH03_22235 [Pseudomonas sp. PA15(2017)]|uniref:hypothetical protein n=1 Tax=Pseudomonas sp. PA15(2017) TaxID=1932111 RepID=UPI0009640937|nr:hypothetical protein [Pseudomonas sp. PA15(2017)]OLU22968.1 hypothetical protein BVH03_22235 [Pseudomonas sp. PA15(2017)]